MVCYYDSSIILSAVLEEKGKFESSSVWDDVSIRLSSNLLRVECIIGVRRANLQQRSPEGDEWSAHRIGVLEQYFSGINFKVMDQSVEDVIRKNADLALCRSLDAIHLATAIYFRRYQDEDLYICSLDRRMREIAVNFDFHLLPEIS